LHLILAQYTTEKRQKLATYWTALSVNIAANFELKRLPIIGLILALIVGTILQLRFRVSQLLTDFNKILNTDAAHHAEKNY
jgi:hypothetical protein